MIKLKGTGSSHEDSDRGAVCECFDSPSSSRAELSRTAESASRNVSSRLVLFLIMSMCFLCAMFRSGKRWLHLLVIVSFNLAYLLLDISSTNLEQAALVIQGQCCRMILQLERHFPAEIALQEGSLLMPEDTSFNNQASTMIRRLLAYLRSWDLNRALTSVYSSNDRVPPIQNHYLRVTLFNQV